MTTIAYDRPVKDLIAQLSATGHVTHTAFRKTSVTFHHNAGRLSHEGVLDVWKVRPASAHFDVDRGGAVCQYVKVNEYAWATGSRDGNRTSISIELANEALGPDWVVSERTWKAGARLAGWLFAKVIGTRPSRSNVFFHSHWLSTTCAGPHMGKVYDELLADVIRAYEGFTGSATPSRPAKPAGAPLKSERQIAAEVWQGKWGSGDDRRRRLEAAGHDPDAIQALVNRGVGKDTAAKTSAGPPKSVTEIAKEVIAGAWGNGDDRRRRLTKAGYNAAAVQNEVNRLLR